MREGRSGAPFPRGLAARGPCLGGQGGDSSTDGGGGGMEQEDDKIVINVLELAVNQITKTTDN